MAPLVSLLVEALFSTLWFVALRDESSASARDMLLINTVFFGVLLLIELFGRILSGTSDGTARHARVDALLDTCWLNALFGELLVSALDMTLLSALSSTLRSGAPLCLLLFIVFFDDLPVDALFGIFLLDGPFGMPSVNALLG